MIEIVPYKAEHVMGMKVSDFTPAGALDPDYLKALERSGAGYSLMIRGRAVASTVFVKLLWPGVAEAVMIACSDIGRYRASLYRVCSRLMETLQTVNMLHRLEARIAETSLTNRRWAEALGFEAEGPIRAFGANGEDYIQYARVRRELCPGYHQQRR